MKPIFTPEDFGGKLMFSLSPETAAKRANKKIEELIASLPNIHKRVFDGAWYEETHPAMRAGNGLKRRFKWERVAKILLQKDKSYV